jgi:hypothetical protein
MCPVHPGLWSVSSESCPFRILWGMLSINVYITGLSKFTLTTGGFSGNPQGVPKLQRGDRLSD